MNENVFSNFPVLETERLTLRQVSISDAEAYFKMRTDSDIMRYMDTKSLNSLDEAKEKIISEIESFENKSSVYWVIAQKETDVLMGAAGYWRLIKEHYRAEIGYQLLSEYWRKGYALEALVAIIDFGFKEMGLHSIEANTNPENIASKKLLEKLGFVQETYFKENYFFNGEFIDSAIFSLLVSDWRKS